MADTTSGGTIINDALTLTCIGRTILAVGTWVEVVGDYEVDLPSARGSLSVLGFVIVGNKNAGEDVSVMTDGDCVYPFPAADIIDAGNPVVIDANGKVSAYDPSSSPGHADNCCNIAGLALTSAAQAGQLIDVVVD